MVSPTMKLMLALTALTSISGFSLPSQDNGKCTCDLDLALVLDSSDHVMKDNFIAERLSTVDLVGRFYELEERLGAKNLRRRTAVMQYSNIIEPKPVQFSELLSDEQVQNTIRNFKYIKSSQKTVYAINEMTKIYLNESPDKHIRVALLYTDDEQRYDLRQAVKAAKRDHNITFITVGIKDRTSMACHLNAAGDDICEMRDLDKIIGEITKTLNDEVAAKCTCIVKPPCNCTDGEKGEPGPPGDKGLPGIPGFNGADGKEGPPGRNGDPGRNGTPGNKGPPGDKGDMGPCGIRGIPGYMGPPGRDGENGRKGQKGGPGRRGPDGPEGSQGTTGEPGYDGPPGQKGERGPAIRGRPGERGMPGDMGPEGPPGNGTNGDIGPRGKEGDGGARGEKGDTGMGKKGEEGHDGPPGQKGEPGRGSPGDKGPIGTTGHSGPPGLPGLNGRGDMGKPGPEGPMGNPGPVGNSMRGPVGPQGHPGEQGPPGADGIGTPGHEGAVGEKGVDGRPGNNGEDGAPGHRGEIGSKGRPGLDGKPGRGIKGDKGDTGKPGSRGPPGYPGRPGDQGAKGENGTAGMTGKTGPQGPATQGPKGPVGLPGPHGPPGPSVTGPKGKQGKPGPPGMTGAVGQPGASLPGYMGLPGLNGTKGEPGPGGIGNPGPPGDNGYRGDTGEVGPPGKVVTVNGKDGSQGLPGPRGPKGMEAKGAPGAPGPKGKPGPTGPQGVGYPGEKGEPGIPGKDGPKGDTGAIGPDGPPGHDGEKGQPGPCALTKKMVIDEIHKICVCTKVICKNLPPLELVFIVDSSGSITPKNFTRFVKPFVRDLVGKFTISPEATRVGLVLYSEADQVNVVFNLNEYETVEEIKERIMNMSFYGGGTHTGKAIKMATEKVFNNARDVRKVAIVITDGESNDSKELQEAVTAANGKDIELHAVGIHDIHDKNFNEELIIIASKNLRHVHHVSDTSKLAESDIRILGNVCTQEDDGAVKSEEFRVHRADRRCNLPAKQEGTCGNWTQVYSYVKQDKTCVKFWYGGCGGNDNRFETEEECKTACL